MKNKNIKLKKITKIPKIPKRALDTHKGQVGKVLILAGSYGMTGAAYLTAKSALLSGAGLVTLGIPKSLNTILSVLLPSCVKLPLPETKNLTLSKDAEDIIIEKCKHEDCVALGPGLTQNSDTAYLVRRIVPKIEKPLLIDADGLNILSKDTRLLKRHRFSTIITPHIGEMSRLTGISTKKIIEDRIDVASDFARKHNIIVVLKGYHTIVTDGKRYYINKTGNPGMATGGTGDVLVGIITGLWCQGLTDFEAAQLGVYIHGLAGDIGVKEKGTLSLIAEDMLCYLPDAFKTYFKIQKRKRRI